MYTRIHTLICVCLYKYIRSYINVGSCTCRVMFKELCMRRNMCGHLLMCISILFFINIYIYLYIPSASLIETCVQATHQCSLMSKIGCTAVHKTPSNYNQLCAKDRCISVFSARLIIIGRCFKYSCLISPLP